MNKHIIQACALGLALFLFTGCSEKMGPKAVIRYDLAADVTLATDQNTYPEGTTQFTLKLTAPPNKYDGDNAYWLQKYVHDDWYEFEETVGREGPGITFVTGVYEQDVDITDYYSCRMTQGKYRFIKKVGLPAYKYDVPETFYCSAEFYIEKQDGKS